MNSTKVFILIAIFSTYGMHSFAQKKAKDNQQNKQKLLTEKIIYNCFILSADEEGTFQTATFDISETEKINTFFNRIIEYAKQPNVTLYSCPPKSLIYDYTSPIAYESELFLSSNLYKTDTIQIENPEPPYEIYDTVIVMDFELPSAIRFAEKWRFNENTFEIKKVVLAYCPVRMEYDYEGEFRGFRPLFWIWNDSLNNLDSKNKVIIASNITYDVIIRSYYAEEMVDEQEKYSMIEYEWMHNNIEASKRIHMLTNLFRAVYHGEIPAYDPNTGKLLTHDDIQKILVQTETEELTLVNPEPPYNDFDTIISITKQIPVNCITSIRFLEEWSFDTVTLKFYKKVLGIAPVYQEVPSYSYENNGQGTPLFWIYFNK